MADVSANPSESFRLSQLIYDSRYRSLTIQTVAMFLLVAAFVWLGSNAATNLAKLGRGFDLGFLSQPAGYDINLTLISYTSQSTHGHAVIVGMLNTLLVAFLGCVLATVIGVIAGVLRLSNNWIVSRLMTAYVEGFRNIPLLLWLLLIFAVLTEATPQPRDFRPGADGLATAAMMFNDSVAITNRGTYIPAPVWGPGSGILAVVFLLSIGAAIAWRRHARKALFDTGRVLPVAWPMLAMLFVPSLLVYLVLGRPISFEYPELTGFNFSGGIQILNSLMALWLALSLYTGAFIAEIVRSGILAVSKGQTEASYALGLRPGKTLNLVVLPQALRVIVPPLISQYLNLTKNSSLAIAVGYPDVRATLGGTAITTTGKELEGMVLMGLFYLTVSLAISGVMNVYNNRVKLKER
jgi:general L-amino acid transport system permease protein